MSTIDGFIDINRQKKQMDINVIMFNTRKEYLIYYMNKPNEEEVINKYLNITLTN